MPSKPLLTSIWFFEDDPKYDGSFYYDGIARYESLDQDHECT